MEGQPPLPPGDPPPPQPTDWQSYVAQYPGMEQYMVPYQYNYGYPMPYYAPYPQQPVAPPSRGRGRARRARISNPVRCLACQQDFKDQSALDAHSKHHVTCPYPDCTFTTSRTLMMKHTIVDHQKLVPNLDTPEAIAQWREERRKKYPTTENMLKKQEEEAAKVARGEVVDKPAQFESKKTWDGKKRRRTCKYHARGKCKHGDSCKYSHDGPSKRQKREKPSLLRRLLDPEIRADRSIMLQCFRRLTVTDFAIAKKM